MSLDLTACVQKITPEEFEKKYGFKQEEVEDLLPPDKDDFFYRLHPEFLKPDFKKYNELSQAFEEINVEISSFQIGYGHFHFLRIKLAKALEFDVDDVRDVNGLGTTFSVNWGKYRTSEEENAALKDFYTHSVCDGMMSIEHVFYLNKFLSRNSARIKNAKVSKEYKQLIKEFLDFTEKSASKGCYWMF